jgi:hypothetical protein
VTSARSAQGFSVGRIAVAVTALVFTIAGCTPPREARVHADPAPEFGDAFWHHWGDGRGELSGYDLVTPRYGAPRHGIAVAIFVTETFSNAKRVKADPGEHPRDDEFPVMKLNLVQDFSTGIYDYNLLTSAFIALAPVNARPAGSPTKVSFSAQEWCGHVYSQVLFDVAYARITLHSYFDREADSDSSLEVPPATLAEDALALWARGFSAPMLTPGDSAERPLLTSLRESRLLHRQVRMTMAVFRRATQPESLTVPAGTFAAERREVAVKDGRTWTFWTERDEPHRLLKWSCSDGEEAQLLGSDRLKYWELNAPGGEQYLAKLGLKPRPPRTP